jgi:hypothetical protein
MLRKHLMGKDGYLAYQSAWFDKYLNHFSHPAAHALGYTLFFGFAFVLYEALAWLLSYAKKRERTINA